MIVRAVVMTSVLVASVAGCAGSVAEPASPAPVAGSPSAAPVQPVDSRQQVPEETISVRISDGRVTGTPDKVEVNRGTRVRIEVTSDRSDEVHVHGYDKTAALTSGQPSTVQFVADVPGVFEVETHEGGLLLFQLVVRG